MRIELTSWDNEDAGDAGAGADVAAAADAVAAKEAQAQAAAKKEKTFTQDEVNKIVGERQKNLKTRYETMEKNYDTLLEAQNLSQKQRETLEADRESLRMEMLTKEQQLEEKNKQASKKYEAELASTKSKAEQYQALYETSTINREIQDAALSEKAFNPSQFIAELAPKTVMSAEMDSEGNSTGRFMPVVKWETVDEETGQPKTLNLTPEEAVKRMKDDVKNYGNLFTPNVAAGIGSGTAPGQSPMSGQVDHSRMSTEDFMKMAETPEGRKALGIAK